MRCTLIVILVCDIDPELHLYSLKWLPLGESAREEQGSKIVNLPVSSLIL